MKWQDWLLAVIFIAAFGRVGSDDFDYRCKQAHLVSPGEKCRMIAAETKLTKQGDRLARYLRESG